jgi:UDP-glucose 4-epimerase
MKKVLVLGANGFIGSHLVDSLVAAGYPVRTLERPGSRPRYDPHALVERVEGDFLNRADIAHALDGIQDVYHLVSTTTPVTAEDDPAFDIDTNVRASVSLFEQCVKQGIERVLFASTGGSIYGDNDEQPFTEQSLTLPISPYAIGKLSIEGYLRYFKRKHGLDSVIFRISNPYGDRQPLHARQGVIPIFLENICQDKPLEVYGDGSMVRDYLFVKDLTNMLVAASEHGFTHHVYNVGSGKGVSVNELIEVVKNVTQKEVVVNHRDVPPTFVHAAVLDCSRFYEEFSITPSTPLQEGMRLTYQYIKQQLERQ